jgi:leucyl/phenylalanyl-tRNA---protein transferase
MNSSALRRRTVTPATIDLSATPAQGPVAFGGSLRPGDLLVAYRHGLYPFPADGVEHRFVNELTYGPQVEAGRINVFPSPGDPFSVAWCSPDPRPLIRPGSAHLSSSLRKQLRNKLDWTTTVDRCFRRVVLHCREGRSPRWLTDDLVEGLCGLHDQGYAHSVEVWDGAELAGGMFGVLAGPVFSADSQFGLRSGAATVAVADLARRFADAGGLAVDVQQDGEQVQRLGARPVPRSQYLELLRTPTEPAPLCPDRLPARRLAE